VYHHIDLPPDAALPSTIRRARVAIDPKPKPATDSRIPAYHAGSTSVSYGATMQNSYNAANPSATEPRIASRTSQLIRARIPPLHAAEALR
jgi:hypothetical protein